MRAELLELAADLARRGEPFVLATVVRRESYSSAHQGDMAVITADGGYHGWLGGNCTQPIVKSEAARALLDGKPRLVSLSPEPDREARPGVVALPMRCHSGGTVDIYLEPVPPLWHRIGSATTPGRDRKSTRLNSSHRTISYAVFCLKKKKNTITNTERR